jgi:WD40 repeat protein
MPGDGGPAGAGRRFLIATATAHHAKAPAWDRPGLEQARDRVVELFTGRFGYEHVSTLGLDPTQSRLVSHLRAFCRSSERRPDDLLAVYIAGHGEVLDEGREHVLLTADTDPDDMYDALPTARLVRKMLLGTKVRRLLLMLDTCYSGQGGDEAAAAALDRVTKTWQADPGSGFVVISSAQPGEQAAVGVFPDLLADAVDSVSTAGHGPETLALDAVVAAMNTHPDRPGFQRITLAQAGLTGLVPAFLPNPRHDPLLNEVDLAVQQAERRESIAERRETEFTRRLLIRAMADHRYKGQEGRWWFSGRHRALTDVTGWLTAPDPARPALAVTAGPGSGKSAVLGLITALSQERYRPTVPLDTLGLPHSAVPPLGAVDVTIYAQQLTDKQVVEGLAAAARVEAATPGELLSALRGTGQRLTAIIDALDEAATPDTLARSVLRPLIEHADGRLRLLLGTRPHLLGVLGLDRDTSVDLDAEHYADLAALTHYTVRGLLQSAPDSPFHAVPLARTRAVADAVAAASMPSFLVARINAATLAAADTVPDPRDPAWRAGLPRVPGEAMRRDLDSRLGTRADKARDLLRPLAWAEGQGLPWEDLWAPLASRLSGRSYDNADLHWLTATAGAYIVEATEADRSAYRLYHQALAEHLREGADPAAVHDAFTTVLIDRVPYGADGTRDWAHAHPYTLRHLATHAAAAGRIDPLIAEPGYLTYAHPDSLIPALRAVTTYVGRTIRAVYRTSAHRHPHLTPAGRRQVLTVDAARHGAESLRRGLNETLSWPVRWATGSQTSRALEATLTEHTGPVRAVACTTMQGRPVAVTAGDDLTVRVWDLITGTQYAKLTGHTSAVLAVACATVEGCPVAVTIESDNDGVARVWDLSTGNQRAVLTGHTGTARAVACTTLDGCPVAVTTGYDRAVRVWDLTTGTPRGALVGHTGLVLGVACTAVDDSQVVVTVGNGPVARVWDLAAGTQHAELTGHVGPVLEVACATVEGKPVAVTSGRDGTVRVWDLDTGKQRAALIGHTGMVDALACSTLDGQSIAVTGGRDGTVRTWDLATGIQIALTGHTETVRAVACTTVQGRPIAVTTGHSGMVQMWDLSADAQRAAALAGHVGVVRAVACTTVQGTPVAVTGGDDQAVRVWDLAVGTQRAELTGHVGPVRSVACTMIEGGPVAVTGDRHGTVRVWDLRTATQRAELIGHVGPVLAVACTTLEGDPAAVTVGNDRTVRVWDLAAGVQRSVWAGHIEWTGVVPSSTAQGRPTTVTAGIDRAAQVWDLSTGAQGSHLARSTGFVYAAACLVVEGRLIAVTVADDHTVQVWDLESGSQRVKLAEYSGMVNAVACTTVQGRPVAITSNRDGTVRIWDLDTGNRRAKLTGHSGAASAVARTTAHGSPTTDTGTDDDTVRAWHTAEVTGRINTVRAVVCGTVQGRPIAVTTGDGHTVRIWDLETATLQAEFPQPSSVEGLAIGPGGEVVVASGWEVIVLERAAF